MSETEYIVGKLNPVKMDINLENTVRQLLRSWDVGKDDDYPTFTKQLEEEYFDDAIIINGELYTIEKTDGDPDEDIFNARKNDDGSISYEVKYYNGGCAFSEALEIAVKKLDV